MSKLGEAKTLGGIGSILQIIPGVSIVGYILVLIGVKYISDDLGDKKIFDNMLYAVITGIVGVAVGAFVLFTGAVFGIFTLGISAIGGLIAGLAIVWVFLIISSIFIRRAFDTMATRLGVKAFGTAGMLYFVGALTSVILVGFLILFVAFIFQIVAFFSIQEVSPSAPVQGNVPSTPRAGTKFCPNCGTQMDAAAAFCPKCGAKQAV